MHNAQCTICNSRLRAGNIINQTATDNNGCGLFCKIIAFARLSLYNTFMRKEVTLLIYLTGKHALNLSCSLNTCGDWHQPALKWEDLTLRDSDDSAFGDYGIEYEKTIPNHKGTFSVANHIRALLDLLETGNFAVAQGMNNNFICNSEYDNEVFDLVSRLEFSDHWQSIDRFMGREYLCKWLDYRKGRQI